MLSHSGSTHTRVGLNSSEPILLAGIESAFEAHPSIVTVTADLDFLLSQAGIRYLVLDVTGGSTWMTLQSKVRRIRPDMRQIVLAPSGSDAMMIRSIAAGARGFLDSNAGPAAIRKVVESVILGSIWAPRRVLSGVIDHLMMQPVEVAPAAAVELSPREREVLNLIMSARSNREIATELGIEERTVKAYVANLMRKTGAENRVSLSVQATRESMRDDRVLPS